MKKAFITGINGQDGSYLSEYLLSLGYEVYGIVRRNSVSESQQSRFSEETRSKLNIFYGDLLDQSSLEQPYGLTGENGVVSLWKPSKSTEFPNISDELA